MDRDQYNELKKTGGLVADAALHSEDAFIPEVVDDDLEEVKVEEDPTITEDVDLDREVEDDIPEDDDLPALTEKEKTAFEKRMERERAKLQEKIEAELKDRYEQQYGKHKQVIDLLGGDVDAIERRIREQRV